MRGKLPTAAACAAGYPLVLYVVASWAAVTAPPASFALMALAGFVLGAVIPSPPGSS
jgi:hypothetical protein